MRRRPVAGVDLRVYGSALLLFARNPAIVIVPFLALIVGVLIRQVIAPYGGGALGSLTYGIAQWIAALLMLLGLGSACIMADEAWRRGRASFDSGWVETQRRAGEILSAAVGMTFIVFIAQYVAAISAVLGIILSALAVYFLIWTIPAAATGGIPGGAAIQVSIDRVRSAPLAAAIATVVALFLILYAAPLAAGALTGALVAGLPYSSVTETLATQLVGALFQSIALAYSAVFLTKTYTDVAFTRRY
jgi:hypothetical protein